MIAARQIILKILLSISLGAQKNHLIENNH